MKSMALMADRWETPMLFSFSSPYLPRYFGDSLVPVRHLLIRFIIPSCIPFLQSDVHSNVLFMAPKALEGAISIFRFAARLFYVLFHLGYCTYCGDSFFVSILVVSCEYVHDLG